MDDQGPSKADIASVFKRLRSFAPNKVCFDCGAKNPTWSSVTYGVFICIDCSAVHRGLGVHLSFVRSTQLDTNWTWLQLRAMQVGGNSNATQFFRQHGCTSTDAQQKYKSRAAQMYRDKLHHLASAAIRLHGTKLHIENQQEQMSPVGKEADFFEEIEVAETNLPAVKSNSSLAKLNLPTAHSSSSLTDQAYIITPKTDTGSAPDSDAEVSAGPKVDHVLGDSPTPPSDLKPSAIGQRKPQPKKGMGGTKKGFGAQKVATNFTEIEKQAETIDKQKESFAVDLSVKESSKDAVPQLSARLMVQDLSGHVKKQEEQLKRMDPKKAEHADRLGIGLLAGSTSSKGGVSHSVMNDMKAIQQEGTGGGKRSGKNGNQNGEKYTDNFEDEWEVVSKDIGSSKLTGSSSFGSLGSRDSIRKEDDFFSDFGVSANKTSSNWSTTDDTRPKRAPVEAPITDEAQKKFGKAKAISSDQFFGGNTTSFETRTNLSRFEGSNAISSADFFGDSNSPTANSARKTYSSGISPAALPDMAEISDSVRQGVTKVAGKLSNLSRNVSSYMSDRYGGY